MRLAVTHLTRMRPGYICVAGVDANTGAHVRPVQPVGQLSDALLSRRGGPFDMATVVDLGTVRPVGQPPEVEDLEFTPWHARAVQSIEPDLFWEMLEFLSRPTLREIFGPDLRPAGRDSAIVNMGYGHASLGCLRPARQPVLYVTVGRDGKPRLRLRISDGVLDLDLAVTDLRFYEADHVRLRTDDVDDALDRLATGVPVLLSLGLTRAFAPRDSEAPVHWLQVNNLHFEDDPCWRLISATSAIPLPPPRQPVRTEVTEDDDLEDLPF